MDAPALPDPAALSRGALLDELACYLRPPGQGIHAVSTGRVSLLAKTQAYLGASWEPDSSWRAHLDAVLTGEARCAILAIPSDTGAGIVRGAAWGPEAIRGALGAAPVPDLGDVFCIPQLLDEEMLSDSARTRCQDALWPELSAARRHSLPVSPLGMAERARRLVSALVPGLRLFMLGGDHTVTWPVLKPLLEGDVEDLGVLHFDAHTDLLPARLGIVNCFATWAFHANAALGGGQRLLQIGIRASGRDRAHWEESLGVRQLWGSEIRELAPADLASLAVTHLRARGVRRVYISNDIDGTDAHWAGACGTPEPDGLTPAQVETMIRVIGAEFEVVGADLVELAPGLGLDQGVAARSIDTALRYARVTLEALQSAPTKQAEYS